MAIASLPSKTGQIRKENEILILAAAEQEFADRGFDGAVMGSIAKRAGLARANIYYYFNSREQLYWRLLKNIVAKWNKSFPDINREDDPANILGAYIKAKVKFSLQNPAASKIFAAEILRGAPIIGEYLEDLYGNWLRGRVYVIEAWIQAGKMDRVDPHHLIFMIWSTTQHYADFDFQVKAALGKDKYTKEDFHKITSTLTHIILKGCGIKPLEDAAL